MLPNDFLAFVHPVLNVSLLKKCLGDPASILPIERLGVDKNLSCEVVLVEILDRQVKCLRNNKVASVKVYGETTLLRKPYGWPRPI